MRVSVGQRGLIVLALVLATTVASAAPSLVDALATDDPGALATAVEQIERAPASPDLADALFGAARACEDRLLDPARALALYDRLLREAPDASVAIAAARRAEALRAQIGTHGEYAAKAADYARLVADADKVPLEDLVRRADELAAGTWPGAADVALWIADALRTRDQSALALRRYEAVIARWPERATAARRGAVGSAIDAHDWAAAERLLGQLSTATPTDALIRDNLRADLTTARNASRLSLGAWLALLVAAVGLLASLGEAVFRGGRRWPPLRPPFEVLFLTPIALVMIAVSFLTRAVIAPAIAQISIGGIGFAWVSGITLDLLRARERRTHVRSILHIVACAAAAIAIGYLAIVRGGLVDMLAETVEAGPGA